MKKFVALCLMILSLGGMAPLSALAFTPDVEILQLKGYSPDTIEHIMAARSRAEWRGMAPPKRSPVQKFFYNIIHNNAIDSIDEPGQQIIRRD
ncbi:MAG: hypothetical protein HEQ32_03470 [Vampirovibrio sp.]|jgi:hypothetical protein